MDLPIIISPAQLNSVNESNLKVVDLRTLEHYQQGHVPGSVHLDAALLNRTEKPASGLLPDAKGMSAIITSLRLSDADHIVAYDGGKETAAARLIWVLHAYGFQQTSWLSGGFLAWQQQNMPVSKDSIASASGDIDGKLIELQYKGENVITSKDLAEQLHDKTLSILDVRSAAEYAGTDVRSARGGHVPGAKHYEWTTMLQADATIKTDDEIKSMLDSLGASPDKRVVVYCQTHQRSAVTYVVLKHLGYDQVIAIDGAWSSWGNSANLPVETT